MSTDKGNKAPIAEMGDLHGQLAKSLREAITAKEPKVVELPEDETYTDESGKTKTRRKKVVVYVHSPAAMSVAAKFLKDNDIKADMAPGSDLEKLYKALPFQGEDAEAADGETLQ